MRPRVLLTGATGLIGREAIPPLLRAGFTVYALSRGKITGDSCVVPLSCNLFDETEVAQVCRDVHAQYLLHFAWIVGDGWLNSSANARHLEAGKTLLHHFSKWGGRRVVMAGSGAEYAIQNSPIRENALLTRDTPYAANKNALREFAEEFCRIEGLSFGWGRIFNVFGHGEHCGRLTRHLLDNLLEGHPVDVRHGSLIRDYMYSKDIGAAFTTFLASEITGSVNICTGQGITLGGYAHIFAEKIGCPELLKVFDEPTSQAACVVGDNTRLRVEVGFQPHFSLPKAVDEIIRRARKNAQ